MKRDTKTVLWIMAILIFAIIFVATCDIKQSDAYSGNCGIWVQPKGYYTPINKPGDSTGFGQARDLCIARGGGVIKIGPGCESTVFTYPDNANILVIRENITGLTVDPFPGGGGTGGTFIGGAIRIVEGVQFPFTMAGLQAAQDEVEAAGGGLVIAPTGMNIPLTTVPFKVGNRVKVMFTADHTVTPTFIASASTNVTAAIMPKDTTGVQGYMYVEGAFVSGNRASGGWVGAGILLKGIVEGSRLKDCLLIDCRGHNLKIDGGTTVGVGQLLLDNITTSNAGNDNILTTGSAEQIVALNTTSNNVSPGKAAWRIEIGIGFNASSGHQIYGFHTEGTTASDGIVLDGVSGCLIDGAKYTGNGSAFSLIRISGVTVTANGAYGAAGHTLRNLTADLPIIIHDISASVIIGNTQGQFIEWYRSPLAPDDRITGQVIGMQPSRLRASIPSEAVLSLVKCGWSDVTITGVNSITQITGNPCFLWQTICFWTSEALQIIDGSNVRLNGNFVGNASGDSDCLCGKWDGANFREVSRSIN